jgi:hypothetical protein
MSSLLENTNLLEPFFDEEDSYYYLENIINKPWFGYTSKDSSLEDVVGSIETFINLHACVYMPQKGFPKFWTPTPIHTFKFIMDKEMNWKPILKLKPYQGFLVQGAAWSNGFYYLVSDKDFLIEANLYIDIQTREQYNYQ